MKTALVLGATGGIGGAVAHALAGRGWKVRALVRDPLAVHNKMSGDFASIEWNVGDAMVKGDLIDAAEGVTAIVHAVNPPGYRNWDRLVLPMIENTIAAAAAVGGARIVLPGTIYNYDPATVSVIDAQTPQCASGRKGKIRVRLERMLEDAALVVPSLIVRAGDFFGPKTRASWFAQSLVKPGQPIRRLLNPAVGPGHSWAYLPDLAETIAQLMDLDDQLAPFEKVQFEGYFDSSGAGMIDAIRKAVKHNVPERAFPWWMMRLLSPFGGFPREVVEIEAYWRHPVKLDNSRLKALLGDEPRTQFGAAIQSTLAGLGCLD